MQARSGDGRKQRAKDGQRALAGEGAVGLIDGEDGALGQGLRGGQAGGEG